MEVGRFSPDREKGRPGRRQRGIIHKCTIFGQSASLLPTEIFLRKISF